MIDSLHVLLGLVVLVVLVLLTMYVTDWVTAKFTAIDARVRAIVAVVTVLVFLVLLVMIFGFVPYAFPTWIRK